MLRGLGHAVRGELGCLLSGVVCTAQALVSHILVSDLLVEWTRREQGGLTFTPPSLFLGLLRLDSTGALS